MEDLLTTYTLDKIAIFVIMLAFAIKGFLDIYDYFKGRLLSWHNKKNKEEKREQDIQIQFDIDNTNIKKMLESQEQINQKIDRMQDSISDLIDSDKDDIKAWITEKHHHFCYEVKSIDDYSLDTIEKRYRHYVKEGGNSFIENLMMELRALPKSSMIGK